MRNTSGSLTGWPRSTWRRTPGWCAPAARSRPGPGPAQQRLGGQGRETSRTLGRQLLKDGIQIVTLESTSDYWRIWYYLLEAAGLAVQLVNAAQARHLTGRPKTDSGCGWPG